MAPVVIEFIRRGRNILPDAERATSYWHPLFNHTILHMEQAANGPNDRRVQETTYVAHETIE